MNPLIKLLNHFAALAIILSIAAVPQIGTGEHLLDNSQSQPVERQESLTWEGNLTGEIYNAEGELIETFHRENLVTDEGRDYLADRSVGSVSDQDIDYIGLSNASSFSASATRGYLKGEIESTSTNLTRGDASYELRRPDTGCFEVEATWRADEYVDGIKGTGLFIADETGDTQVDSNVVEIAEASLSPSKVLQDGYRYRQTWNVCFS